MNKPFLSVLAACLAVAAAQAQSVPISNFSSLNPMVGHLDWFGQIQPIPGGSPGGQQVLKLSGSGPSDAGSGGSFDPSGQALIPFSGGAIDVSQAQYIALTGRLLDGMPADAVIQLSLFSDPGQALQVSTWDFNASEFNSSTVSTAYRLLGTPQFTSASAADLHSILAFGIGGSGSFANHPFAMEFTLLSAVSSVPEPSVVPLGAGAAGLLIIAGLARKPRTRSN